MGDRGDRRRDHAGSASTSDSSHNDDEEFDNAAIVDSLFEHSKTFNAEFNSALDRTFKRAQRQQQQDFASMKKSLRLAEKSQYTNSNVNNSSFGDLANGGHSQSSSSGNESAAKSETDSESDEAMDARLENRYAQFRNDNRVKIVKASPKGTDHPPQRQRQQPKQQRDGGRTGDGENDAETGGKVDNGRHEKEGGMKQAVQRKDSEEVKDTQGTNEGNNGNDQLPLGKEGNDGGAGKKKGVEGVNDDENNDNQSRESNKEGQRGMKIQNKYDKNESESSEKSDKTESQLYNNGETKSGSANSSQGKRKKRIKMVKTADTSSIMLNQGNNQYRTAEEKFQKERRSDKSGIDVLRIKKQLDNLADDQSQNQSQNPPPSIRTAKTDRTKVVEKSKDDKPVMETNCQLRSWSVSSYDSCGGDTRRNYAAFIATNRRKRMKEKVQNSLAFLVPGVGANGESPTFKIPLHRPSLYEDKQPYGPQDEDALFYEHLDNKTHTSSTYNLFSATLSRLSGKSSGKSKPLSLKKTPRPGLKIKQTLEKVKKRGNTLKTMFQRRFSRASRSRSETEGDYMIDPVIVAEIVEEASDGPKSDGNEQEITTEFCSMNNNIKVMNLQGLNSSTGNADNLAEGVINMKPYKIPPDMEWNEEESRLVNKVPRYIPKGKMWSKTAKRGMGGLVNRPPPVGSLPPNMVWSRTAFNGQGGIVNMPPAKNEIPKGMYWDYEAKKGRGGLVSATEIKMQALTVSDDKLGYETSLARNMTTEENQRSKKKEKHKHRDRKHAKTEKRKNIEVDVTQIYDVEGGMNLEDVQKTMPADRKERKNYVNKTIKGKATPRRNTDEPTLDAPVNDGQVRIPETPPEAFLVEKQEHVNFAMDENMQGTGKGSLLAGEMGSNQDNLTVKENELKQREEKLNQKENELKLRESEIIKRESEIIRAQKAKDTTPATTPVITPINLQKQKPYRASDRTLQRKTMGSTLDRQGFKRVNQNTKPRTKEVVFKKPPPGGVSKDFRKTLNFERNNSLSSVATSLMEEVGIPEGHVQRLFERFERLSRGSDDDMSSSDV